MGPSPTNRWVRCTPQTISTRQSHWSLQSHRPVHDQPRCVKELPPFERSLDGCSSAVSLRLAVANRGRVFSNFAGLTRKYRLLRSLGAVRPRKCVNLADYAATSSLQALQTRAAETVTSFRPTTRIRRLCQRSNPTNGGEQQSAAHKNCTGNRTNSRTNGPQHDDEDDTNQERASKTVPSEFLKLRCRDPG